MASELQRPGARGDRGRRRRDRAQRASAPRMTTAAVADPTAREFLRNADPVLGRLIDAHPDFRPRAWIDELPGLDAFGTLIFQVTGQQLSVRATRAILSRLEQSFEGRLPSPAEVLATDPQVAPRKRALDAQGRDAACTRGTVRRRAPERRSARSYDGRRDRDRAHRGVRHRALDSAWVPDLRARPARRAPRRRPRAAARGHAALRARPPPHAKLRWSRWQSAGGRTAASRSATCSHPSSRNDARWTSESSAPAGSDRRWRAPQCAPAGPS